MPGPYTISLDEKSMNLLLSNLYNSIVRHRAIVEHGGTKNRLLELTALANEILIELGFGDATPAMEELNRVTNEVTDVYGREV